MSNKKWYKLLKYLYYRFKHDEIPAIGAQLTYYLILAIFPFLIFLIALVSYTPITVEQAIRNMSGFLPGETHKVMIGVLHQITTPKSNAFISFGMIAAIWTASNGVMALVRGINKAYDKEETRPFWKVRGISVLFTLALALIILFSFIMLVFGELLGDNLFRILGIRYPFKTVWNILRFVIPVITMLIVFICLYYIIPNKRLKFKEVIPGSFFCTFGWAVTSLLFSFYVNNFNNYARTYGSIGGIIALLIWMYWCSIIMLLGAEINAILTLGLDKMIIKRKRLC